MSTSTAPAFGTQDASSQFSQFGTQPFQPSSMASHGSHLSRASLINAPAASHFRGEIAAAPVPASALISAALQQSTGSPQQTSTGSGAGAGTGHALGQNAYPRHSPGAPGAAGVSAGVGPQASGTPGSAGGTGLQATGASASGAGAASRGPHSPASASPPQQQQQRAGVSAAVPLCLANLPAGIKVDSGTETHIKSLTIGAVMRLQQLEKIGNYAGATGGRAGPANSVPGHAPAGASETVARTFAACTSAPRVYAEWVRHVLRLSCSVPVVPSVVKSGAGEIGVGHFTSSKPEMDEDVEEETVIVDIDEDWESEAVDGGYAKTEVRAGTATAAETAGSSAASGAGIRGRNDPEPASNKRRHTDSNHEGRHNKRAPSPERSVFSAEQQTAAHYFARAVADSAAGALDAQAHRCATSSTARSPGAGAAVQNSSTTDVDALSKLLALLSTVSQQSLLDTIRLQAATVTRTRDTISKHGAGSDEWLPQRDSGSAATGTATGTSSTSAAAAITPSVGTKRGRGGDGGAADEAPPAGSTSASNAGRYGLSALYPALGRSPAGAGRPMSAGRGRPSTGSSSYAAGSGFGSGGDHAGSSTPASAAETSTVERRFNVAVDCMRTSCAVTHTLMKLWPSVLSHVNAVCEVLMACEESFLESADAARNELGKLDAELLHLQSRKGQLDADIQSKASSGFAASSAAGSGAAVRDSISVTGHSISGMTHATDVTAATSMSLTAALDLLQSGRSDMQQLFKQRQAIVVSIRQNESKSAEVAADCQFFDSCVELSRVMKDYCIVSAVRAQSSLQRALTAALALVDSASVELLAALVDWSASEDRRRTMAITQGQELRHKLNQHVSFYGPSAPKLESDLRSHIDELHGVLRSSEVSASRVMNTVADAVQHSLSHLPLEMRQTIMLRCTRLLVEPVDIHAVLDASLFWSRLRTSAQQAASLRGEDPRKYRSPPAVRHMHVSTVPAALTPGLLADSPSTGADSGLASSGAVSNLVAVGTSPTSAASQEFPPGSVAPARLQLARACIRPVLPILSKGPSNSAAADATGSAAAAGDGRQPLSEHWNAHGSLFDSLSILAPGPALPVVPGAVDEEIAALPADDHHQQHHDDKTVYGAIAESGLNYERAHNGHSYEDNDGGHFEGHHPPHAPSYQSQLFDDHFSSQGTTARAGARSTSSSSHSSVAAAAPTDAAPATSDLISMVAGRRPPSAPISASSHQHRQHQQQQYQVQQHAGGSRIDDMADNEVHVDSDDDAGDADVYEDDGAHARHQQVVVPGHGQGGGRRDGHEEEDLDAGDETDASAESDVSDHSESGCVVM